MPAEPGSKAGGCVVSFSQFFLGAIQHANINKSQHKGKDRDEEGKCRTASRVTETEHLQIGEEGNSYRAVRGSPIGDHVDNVKGAEGFHSADDQRNKYGGAEQRQTDKPKIL